MQCQCTVHVHVHGCHANCVSCILSACIHRETNESVLEQKKGELEQWLKNHMKRGEVGTVGWVYTIALHVHVQ